MTRSHTTEILFDDDSGYFVALTDMPGVRIGLKNCTMYDVPRGHAWYDRIVEAMNRAAVEALHDELFDAYAGESA